MISIIVAISKNNVIGKDGALPWHYPEDLKYFKEITLNHTVIMGTNTFKSVINRINQPLPNRRNIVVTRNKDFKYPNVEVIHNLDQFLNQNHQEEIFIIGGKQIFDISLKYTDRLYITHIDKEYEGDVYFSDIDYHDFELISKYVSGELSFCVYERIKK